MKSFNKKKIKIILEILLCLIFVLLIIINLVSKKNNTKELIIVSEIDTVQELLEYYDCKEINIKDGSIEPFEKDIYLTFGEDLWKDGNSNESYFSGIILYLTELLEYKNYRLIDTSKNIIIAVIANNEEKKTEAIYINGEINYFQKEEAKQIVKEDYKQIESINMTIDAREIIELINNNWKANTVSFGSRESRFEDYDIYFDEGIEVKTLGGKVYNIIFTEKYKETIINGIRVNDSKDKITSILDKPQFEQNNIIGYKGNEIYVFFSKNEVSVYRIEKDYKTEEFLKIWQEFSESKNSVIFVDKLTDLWQDYDEYNYDTRFISLKYTLRGLCVEINTSGENGLVLYNNYGGELQNGITLENLTAENIPENVYLHLDKDLVFSAEYRRKTLIPSEPYDEYLGMLDSEKIPLAYLENGAIDVREYLFSTKQTDDFLISYSYTNEEGIYDVKFISKNREYPNSELIRHKQIYTYGWIDNEQFVYSVKGKGIYCYNAKTRVLKTIIEGNKNFKIKGIQENVLLYDDTSIKIK